MAATQDPLLAEDLPDLTHGQSLGRHPTPLWGGGHAGPSSAAKSIGTVQGRERRLFFRQRLGVRDADPCVHDGPNPHLVSSGGLK